MITFNEKTMQNLEAEIPKLASGATKQAYLEALATGSSVVKVIENQLIEYFADGTFTVLKNLEAPTKVEAGSTVRLSA